MADYRFIYIYIMFLFVFCYCLFGQIDQVAVSLKSLPESVCLGVVLGDCLIGDGLPGRDLPAPTEEVRFVTDPICERSVSSSETTQF